MNLVDFFKVIAMIPVVVGIFSALVYVSLLLFLLSIEVLRAAFAQIAIAKGLLSREQVVYSSWCDMIKCFQKNSYFLLKIHWRMFYLVTIGLMIAVSLDYVIWGFAGN